MSAVGLFPNPYLRGKDVYRQKCDVGGLELEHKTCDIFAAERLRLMSFDNRLIIDSFQEAICILKC